MQAKADPGSQSRWTTGDPGDRLEAVGAAQRARRAAARRDAPSPPRRDALPLVLEQSREGLPARAVPAGLRAGRALRRRVRAGVQAAAHVRGRSHPVAVGHRGAVRAGRICRRRRSRTRSACIRARPSGSRSRSSRASRATSRSACGTRRSRCEETADGTLTLTLHVSNDWALRSWIWDSAAGASRLAAGAGRADPGEIERARSHYVPGLDFELPASEST